jgi:multicomponent Na+:H+ antiporter subunit B
MTPIELALAVFVLLTAVATAAFRDVLASIVVFAAYSLGLAALYLFFRAPDVALTEAAIGAGITTVLLLVTIAKTTRQRREATFDPVDGPALLGVAALGAVLLVTLPAFPAVGAETAPIPSNAEVTGYYLANAYAETEVENAVTAVLAAYRGFDTFGEAVVVFAAGVAGLLVLRREAFV